MEKITLGELINKYSKENDSVTVLNDANRVVKIFTSRNVPEEFRNKIVKVFNMFAVNSRATAFAIEVKLK